MVSKWNTKNRVNVPSNNSFKRLFEPAKPLSSVTPSIKSEDLDGCVKPQKFERTLKLRFEDMRNKTYNIISGSTFENKAAGFKFRETVSEKKERVIL